MSNLRLLRSCLFLMSCQCVLWSQVIPLGPSNWLVNIDHQSGAHCVFSNCVQVALDAGVYKFALVSPDDCPEAQFMGWSYSSGQSGTWVTATNIWPEGSGDCGGGLDELGVGSFNGVDSAQDAWNDLLNDPRRRLNLIVLDGMTQIHFYLSDNQVNDNQGGMTVLISDLSIRYPDWRSDDTILDFLGVETAPCQP